MRFGALIGWGIVIYAVMYLTWTGMVMHGFTDGVLPRLASLLVLIVTATIAGRSLRFDAWKDILPYSISWAIVVGLFDMAYSLPYAGWHMYADWNVWVGYLLVVCIPLFSPLTRPHHAVPPIS